MRRRDQNTVQCCELEPSNAASYQALLQEATTDSFFSGSAAPYSLSIEECRQQLSPHSNHRIIGAFHCGLLGMVGLGWFGQRGRLFGMYTRVDQRGLGIGRLLLNAVLDLAEDRQLSNILLEVATSNVAARALYESAGYEPTGGNALTVEYERRLGNCVQST